MAGFDADIIWGNGKEDSLGDNLSVTIIATGFSTKSIFDLHRDKNSGQEKFPLIDENVNVSGLGKKDNPTTIETSAGQNFVEFDITKEKQKEESDFAALYPNTSKKRETTSSNNVVADYLILSDEDVDELENIPAYKRRQIRMNDPQYKKQASNISVTKDNKISNRNQYLHDQVD
jgi:cell division protein FtsZ